jgi:hypothetical protein
VKGGLAIGAVTASTTGSPCTGSSSTVVRMHSACARASALPSAASRSAESHWTLRPARSTCVATLSEAIGIGRRISTVTRTTAIPGGRPRSMTLASSAAGGPACWCSRLHGPRVSSVDLKPSPSGS